MPHGSMHDPLGHYRWYISAIPKEGVPNKDTALLLDNFICWDEGVMKKNPFAP